MSKRALETATDGLDAQIEQWETGTCDKEVFSDIFTTMEGVGNRIDWWVRLAASTVLVDRAVAGIDLVWLPVISFLKGVLIRPCVKDPSYTGDLDIVTRHPGVLDKLVVLGARPGLPMQVTLAVCVIFVFLRSRPQNELFNECLRLMYAHLYKYRTEELGRLAEVMLHDVKLTRNYVFTFLPVITQSGRQALCDHRGADTLPLQLKLIPMVLTASTSSSVLEDASLSQNLFIFLNSLLKDKDTEIQFKTTLLDANPTFMRDLCAAVQKSNTLFVIARHICAGFERACTEAVSFGLIAHVMASFENPESDKFVKYGVQLLYVFRKTLKTPVSQAFTEGAFRRLIDLTRSCLHSGDLFYRELLTLFDVAIPRQDLLLTVQDQLVPVIIDVFRISTDSTATFSACLLVTYMAQANPEAFGQLSVLVPPIVKLLSQPHAFGEMFIRVGCKALGELLYFVVDGVRVHHQENIQAAYNAGFASVCRSLTKESSGDCLIFVLLLSVLVLRDRSPELLVENDGEFVDAVTKHAVLSVQEETRNAASNLLRLLVSPEKFLSRRADVVNMLLKMPVPMTAFPIEDGCSICRVEESGSEVVYTPCFHAYHKSCLENWLIVRDVCPVCTKSVLTELNKCV